MQPVNIEKTQTTPKVTFDKARGIFRIEGKSLPEDVREFYNPIMDWLNQYFADPNPETVLTFELQYFNTASSKVLFDIICIMKEPYKNGVKVSVNWCYAEDDEDTLETGKDYESLVKIPFTFTAIME